MLDVEACLELLLIFLLIVYNGGFEEDVAFVLVEILLELLFFEVVG